MEDPKVPFADTTARRAQLMAATERFKHSISDSVDSLKEDATKKGRSVAFVAGAAFAVYLVANAIIPKSDEYRYAEKYGEPDDADYEDDDEYDDDELYASDGPIPRKAAKKRAKKTQRKSCHKWPGWRYDYFGANQHRPSAINRFRIPTSVKTMPSIQPPNQHNITKKQSHNLLTILRERKASGQKSLALLIDPDKSNQESLSILLSQVSLYPVDFFFVGGSLITNYNHAGVIATIRQHSQVPIILFSW